MAIKLMRIGDNGRRAALSAKAGAVALAVMLLPQFAQAASASSIVTEWLDQTIPAANQAAWEPTVGARFFALVHTAMYDAWTAYDPVAVGVFAGTALRGTGGAANVANKREAVSRAAYEVISALAPVRRRALVEYMAALGYAVNSTSAPSVVGHRAAQAVLAAAREDGANQEADYQDTTGYQVAEAPTPSSWQPIDALGAPQLPVSPHWSRVMPFALGSAEQFRPPAPPRPGSAEWDAQIRELIDTSANLNDERKATAEFWVPWGGSPAAHLMELTKFVAARDDLRIDEEIRLFFLVSIALHDTAIAAWDAKYHYDYIRPITAIQALGETRIKAWQPPGLPAAFAYAAPATRGAQPLHPARGNAAAEIAAKDWQPYLPTPAFPAYVSGHSAFTAAWARMAELATGRSEFGLRVTVRRLYTEQRFMDHAIELVFPTYWSAAESSGRSRIYGGIHWPADNREGLALGHAVAEQAWQRGQQFLLGTASPAAAAIGNLSNAYWHLETNPDGTVATADGKLHGDLAPGAHVAWRSVVLDALPAGEYRISAKISSEGAASATLSVYSAGNPEVLFGHSDLILRAQQSQALELGWRSDGFSSFRIELAAGAPGERAQVTIDKMALGREWPVKEGVPRYRAMSDLVLSKARSPGR